METFPEAISQMERAFAEIAALVPMPQMVEVGGRQAYRFQEKTAQQGVIVKLVSIVSALRSAQALLRLGMVNEVSILERVVNDHTEDVSFLCLGIAGGQGELHEKFLAALFQEEFELRNGIPHVIKRQGSPTRKDIRSYIDRAGSVDLSPGKHAELMRDAAQVYSGFVHGSAVAALNLYGGAPGRFHLAGMMGTPRIEVHMKSLWNHYHRGINAFLFAATVLNLPTTASRLRIFRVGFERLAGKHYE
ncbi:MAG: hypothetical protein KDH09_13970 [Chrysiogenetes bacterium]|nr:hypothetical protein [Chrysiogenetes bacterium]